MSFYIDVNYLNQISHRLALFTKKKSDIWNCRCPICNDSQTNKRKARGYFYRKKNDLFYKCHNCDASQQFSTFLKNMDPSLHNQYLLESFQDKRPTKKPETPDPVMHFDIPVFRKTLESRFLKLCPKISTLPPDHEAVVYCNTRKIPLDKHSQIHYIEHCNDIVQIAPDYEDRITDESPRICFPFYNQGKLVGLTMRSIRNTGVRYVMVKLDEESSSIFGFDELDQTKTYYVVEGPIDSLFLPNSIACNGTSFGKLEHLPINKDNAVVVVDNQPRNEQVAKITKKYVDLGYNVCVWPPSLVEKDINDMVLAGIDVKSMIDAHTYHGLMAQLKFTEWSKSK